MYQHFIAVTSVYSKGLRIAWHYSAEQIDPQVIVGFMQAFKQQHRTMKLGIHRMRTDSPAWSSITTRDPFFNDVVVMKDYNEFIQLVQADEGLDMTDCNIKCNTFKAK